MVQEIEKKRFSDLMQSESFDYSITISLLNPQYNRFHDIHPYNHSLVKLKEGYINASFVNLPLTNKLFIAAQAPLETTVNQFYQMIWEYEIQLIIMLNNEQELFQVN